MRMANVDPPKIVNVDKERDEHSTRSLNEGHEAWLEAILCAYIYEPIQHLKNLMDAITDLENER